MNIKKLINSGNKIFVVDLNESEILSFGRFQESKDVIIFNVRSKSDSLRNDKCKNNSFHIPPSYSILSDALTQYLVKKKWNKWFLVIGPDSNDKFYAEALKNSAKKFNIKIKKKKFGILDQILEGRQVKKFLSLLKVEKKYDVLVVADEKGEFGEYLAYRTWDPRP